MNIDFVVGIYGFNASVDAQAEVFLNSLASHNNMVDVALCCVERACRPMSDHVRGIVNRIGGRILKCPIPPLDNCREDTSQYSDWMVANSGVGQWVILSHFDVEFHGDFVGFVRRFADKCSMIGNHHDGILAFERAAYDRCQVGFCGIDRMSATEDRVIPNNCPVMTGRNMLSLDVGELLALRMNTLGLIHTWLYDQETGFGRSNLFTHKRNGSGHT